MFDLPDGETGGQHDGGGSDEHQLLACSRPNLKL